MNEHNFSEAAFRFELAVSKFNKILHYNFTQIFLTCITIFPSKGRTINDLAGPRAENAC